MKRTQIDPFLWELALFASGGDVSRIEIVSELEIVVHNNDTWKKKGRKDNG